MNQGGLEFSKESTYHVNKVYIGSLRLFVKTYREVSCNLISRSRYQRHFLRSSSPFFLG